MNTDKNLTDMHWTSADNECWVKDAIEHYPRALFNGRLLAESAVSGLLWQDLFLLNDNKNLKETSFYSHSGRLCFRIAQTLYSHKVEEVDPSSIAKFVNENDLKELTRLGGYDAMKDLCCNTSLRNKDESFDTLAKYNVYLTLHNKGIDLLTKRQMGQKKYEMQNIEPFTYFQQVSSNRKKAFTAADVLNYYQATLSSIDFGHSSNILDEKQLEFNMEIMKNWKEGKENGSPYTYAGMNYDGTKQMRVFPYLSGQTLGFRRNATHFLAGFSSSGKTCMWCNILMAMARDRVDEFGNNIPAEKVLVICNEQDSNVWLLNMMLYILYRYYGRSDITKKAVLEGKLTDEQEQLLSEAGQYYNKYYSQNITFIQLAVSDMELVKSKIRYYAAIDKCTMVIYDTLKISDLNYRGDNAATTAAHEMLVQYSRDLDNIAKEKHLIMCASVQLAQSNKGQLFLDSSMLSGAKGMVEQLETLLCLRNVHKEELDPTNKLYIRPFQIRPAMKRNENGWILDKHGNPIKPFADDKEAKVDGMQVYDKHGQVIDQTLVQLDTTKEGNIKYDKVPYDFADEIDHSWKVLFIAKNRSAESTDSSGEALMFDFIGQCAVFEEKCWGRPHHGTI